MAGRPKYPWNSLKKPGDTFKWPATADELSLRVQASKIGKRRSAQYSVHHIRRPKYSFLRVKLVALLLDEIGT